MKSNSLPPLLITSCVRISAPYTKLTDTNQRIQLTLYAIRKWIEICPDLKIIICDGSGVDFSNKIYKCFPEKKFEFLTFKNNARLVLKYGKGYGEGEIINYALKHSKNLKVAKCFAKCTSKLFVVNFLAALNKWNGSYLFECNFLGISFFKNIFGIKPISKIKFLSVNTRFFIVNKQLYLSNFSRAYLKVRDREGIYIENIFKEIILRKKIRNFMLNFPLKVEGMSGTSDKFYKKISLFSYFKKILHRLIIKKNQSFRHYFIN
jgi:hypothetical protein